MLACSTAPTPFDLAIIDVMMPEMTGSEVVAELRRVVPTLPIIVSSGFNTASAAESLCAEPRVILLDKPYTAEQLERAILTAIT